MEQVGIYTPTQPVTVYVGKVKGGTGEQIYIPDDVEPTDVFTQVGSVPLLPASNNGGIDEENTAGDDIDLLDL